MHQNGELETSKSDGAQEMSGVPAWRKADWACSVVFAVLVEAGLEPPRTAEEQTAA